MKIENFYELDAWKKAHECSLSVYRATQVFPKSERFGVTNQIRRAVSSVGANIAEGFGRYHFADKIRFYYQARGSLTETQSFLLLTKDLGYLGEEVFKVNWDKTKACEKLISGLISSARRQMEK